MTTPEPWRDPASYVYAKPCYKCGSQPTGPWGRWCIRCNVERFERIGRFFQQLDDISSGREEPGCPECGAKSTDKCGRWCAAEIAAKRRDWEEAE